eukprot:TRINITY_DN473_c8_g1_i1.p1 TRINITY_DN473_c8_g1~~TRINITY_DN473_c8_g1_i1.p1  ORF type:complete len:370 (+),score=93.01 TRINITY_DN473_c8_g1_i1:55-1164(+)
MVSSSDPAIDDWNMWLEDDDVKSFMEVCDVDWEEQDCSQRWFEKAKEIFSMCLLPEEEDMITEEYLEKVHDHFAKTKDTVDELSKSMVKRKNTTTLVSSSALNRRKSSVAKDKHEEDITLQNVDMYGALTSSLLEARMQEEFNDCAENRVKIFYTSIVQFFLSAVVFILGSFEMDGGQFQAVLATSVSACVGVIAAIFGCLGAIGENEGMLVKFMVSNFWLMAILTAFLYTEIYMMKNSVDECTPSKTSLSATTNEGCEETQGRHVSLMILAGLQLACVFVGAALATNVLDSVNDRTRLEQKQLFFVYFRVRNYEAKAYLAEKRPDFSVPVRDPLDDDVLITKGVPESPDSKSRSRCSSPQESPKEVVV